MHHIVRGLLVMALSLISLVTFIVLLCRWNARTRLQVLALLVLLGTSAWVGITEFQAVRALIHEATSTTSCMNNTRQIGLAMLQYSSEHDGEFPKTFGLLVKEGYLTTFKVFVCPSSGHSIPADFPKPDGDNLSTLGLGVLNRIDEWSDYVIVQGVTSDSPANFILIHDKWGSHNGEGSNIWFIDGHVKWHTDLDEMLKEQMKKRRPKGSEEGG